MRIALALVVATSIAHADEDVVTGVAAARIATARTFQDLVLEAPGVVDVNGGGNPQIRGGNLTMNRWRVDGMDVTDPATGGFGANVVFDSIDAVVVRTRAMEAEYDALGGAIDVVTRGPSERLRVDGAVFFGRSDQASLVVDTPLVARKLWLDFAAQYDYTENGFNGFIGRAKLTWKPSEEQRVTVSGAIDPAFIPDGKQFGTHSNALWEYDFSRHVRTSVMLGFLWDKVDFDARTQVQLDPSISLRYGAHDAKIGIQSRLAYRETASGVWGVGAGLFAQDRWRVLPWLRLLPGVRVDWGHAPVDLVGVGPRLGAEAELTRDRRTRLDLFYGRANQTMTLLPAAYAQLEAATLDRHAATPHADELSLGLARAQFGAVARVQYTYKYISNIWDGVHLITTPNDNHRTYHGVDFILDSRFIDNLDLYLAYTVSWLYGPGAEELGQISGMEVASYDGFLPEHVGHVVKLRVSYWWRGLTVGAFARWQTVTPALQVDARVAYALGRVTFIADAFGLAGAAAPLPSRQVPMFATVTRVQEPFRFQLGVRYTY